jgi:hypothetical protein
MAYFLRNFGGAPANCFGQEHIVDIIDTLGKIQRNLFAETGDGSAVGYLRKILHERFDVNGLPEGYFYFPISSGGLELRNTMIEVLLLQMQNKPLSTYKFKDDLESALDSADSEPSFNPTPSDPGYPAPSATKCSSKNCTICRPTTQPTTSGDSDDLADVRAEEETLAEARFSKSITIDKKRYARIKEIWQPEKRYKFSNEFMPFTEYISLRESWLSTWGATYQKMLASPSERQVVLVPQVKAEIENGSSRLSKSWGSLTLYEKWVMSMYGEEVVKKFGGLEAVDPSLIPTGMVKLFQTSRMKLDQ